MGVFLFRHVDLDSGQVLGRFSAGNFLAYESLGHVLHQVFPPYDAAMTFKIGLSGVTANYPELRPNPCDHAEFNANLTFADCVGPLGGADGRTEGGCYTDAMRASFGYARQPVTFTAALEADGGAFVTPEVVFPNNHVWTPQDAADWDLPWTEDEIEQAPPEWAPKVSWEAVHGYPWQRPRKHCETQSDPSNPLTLAPSYMHTWDPTGGLDWLCDFRKMGGLPITLAFLADTSRDKLVAAAGFRAPVLLRPGTALHVRYQARIFGSVTRDFALRLATYAFAQAGSRYATIYCRPLLTTAPAFHRRLTYADIEPFFSADCDEVALPVWTVVAGPPPSIESVTVPSWENDSGGQLGPFGGLAVFGVLSGGMHELMWIAPIAPAVTVPDGDTLRVPDHVRFTLESPDGVPEGS